MQHHFPPDTSEPEIVEVPGETEGPIVQIGISGDNLSGPSLGQSGDQQGASASILLPPILPSIGPDGDNVRLSTLPTFLEEELEGAVGPDPSIGPNGDSGRPVEDRWPSVQEDADDTEELEGAVGPDPQAVSSKKDNDVAWTWTCRNRFTKHVRKHIDDCPDDFGSSCKVLLHIVYFCKRDIQRELFGTSVTRTDRTTTRYKIIRPLGEGSYGICYLVEILRTGKRLAVKKIHEDDFKEREIEVVHVLHRKYPASPRGQKGFAHVYAVTYNGTHIEIFQDYIEGVTIGEMCRRAAELNIRFTANCMLALLHPCCVSLDVIHKAGIVHRDMSKNNIMVALEQNAIRIVIIDFGLSCTLRQVRAVGEEDGYPGNVYYMSPQAARNDNVNCKTDVWGIMMVVFVVLTDGVPLFELLMEHGTTFRQNALQTEDKKLALRRALTQFRDNTSNSNRQQLCSLIQEFGLEEGMMDIVRKCLRCEFDNRFTAQEAAAAANAQLIGQGVMDQALIYVVRHELIRLAEERRLVEEQQRQLEEQQRQQFHARSRLCQLQGQRLVEKPRWLEEPVNNQLEDCQLEEQECQLDQRERELEEEERLIMDEHRRLIMDEFRRLSDELRLIMEELQRQLEKNIRQCGGALAQRRLEGLQRQFEKNLRQWGDALGRRQCEELQRQLEKHPSQWGDALLRRQWDT